MDYEKEYKEALERAREYHKVDKDNTLKIYAKGTMEYLFPVLKESEDEKIRNEICIYIGAKQDISLDTHNKWLAWLERQGRKESDPRYENLEELLAADDIYQMAMNDAMVNEAKEKAVNALSEMCIWRLLGLEKQGKSKFEQCIQDGDKIVTNEDGTHFNISQLERVAKKEPKFKVGDWIVQKYLGKYLGTYKIIEVCESWYEVISYNDGIQYSVGFDKEDDCHIWTIQDAKDGDVLAGSKGDVILMFRGIGNAEWDDVIDYHCYYDCYRGDFIIQKGVEYWGNTKNNQLKPATKEQRDLLFQKMHETGYECDAEKKELKKVEQKPAWSEEDERMCNASIRACQYMIENFENSTRDYEDAIDWLKSLKDRYSWKPSKEQMKGIDCAIKTLRHQLNVEDKRLNSLYEQLKKL